MSVWRGKWRSGWGLLCVGGGSECESMYVKLLVGVTIYMENHR